MLQAFFTAPAVGGVSSVRTSTVFAPTDAAFEALASALGLDTPLDLPQLPSSTTVGCGVV